ncbi:MULTISPECIES: phosphate ABC transporter permease PstA [Dickeya]|uniref:Phosphate transport system permease protein PstA n=1 Tax=Dickeya aquatica TaxID=1401087 RepID=A0A375A826_9GAMM|nr:MULTISPECIES: phosphate ABC transporter permease PstA [Dickeya]SLM62170.1 Phosphate transport system permease protein PstA (TC 3.A.1.7.1) [Dickeya aquatica]
MKRWLATGTPWVWLTASAITFSLVAMAAVFTLLISQSARYLWPQPVWLFSQLDAQGAVQQWLGERYDAYPLTHQQLRDAGIANAPPEGATRYLVKTGWRERYGQSFQALLSHTITEMRQPAEVLAVRRASNGMAYGYLDGMTEDGQPLVSDNLPAVLQQRIMRVHEWMTLAQDVRLNEMSRLNQRFDDLRQQEARLRRENRLDSQAQARLKAGRSELERHFDTLNQQLLSLNTDINRTALVLRDAQGLRHTIPVSMIERAWYPNRLSLAEKARQALDVLGTMLTRFAPDDSSPGQLFPAIFGTVLLVLLMSVIVMPLGVVAAVYLHEYADNNSLTRWVRIAVANLAGVPSIVYGVFGLGFFVYLVGGTLDQWFYAQSLPNPTLGTPGLLWASLTLALLTLPVVIVSTEEGLSRIPVALRHGSLALGATRAETLWRVVLPMAVPSMMTGLILAIARAAGETAPLMLVGVVKSVPALPVDAFFPYLHLERKFMHLGFQIYDLAFQSPDEEAARPLVYITALLLVLIVVALNLAAIGIRHVLREKYRAMSL